MKVLSIGGDKQALEPGTDVHARMAWLRSYVDVLDMYVWPHAHSLRTILRAACTRAYDVVTAQDPFWRGVIAWLAARVTGRRLHIQVHTDLHAHVWWRRLMSKMVLRHADGVRVVSEKIKRQVLDAGVRAPIHVLPVYVDLGRFESVTRVPHDREIILWVGRFEDEKDPLAAIQVLKAVCKKGRDVSLVMLGAGRLEGRLRKAAEGLPVEFPGWKPPEDYLAIADVVLSTSRHESWGASIIEALAARVPVVAPDVGVAKEAGAIVASRSHLANVVEETLRTRPEGRLKLAFLDRDEWARRWKDNLAAGA